MTGSTFPKLVLAVAALGIFGCLSVDFSGVWEINVRPSPSVSSGYYVLHDWQNTYSSEDNVTPFPASSLSDIMLKTMGILRDGASWPGVVMGNLFSRPSATALFVVDGVSSGTSMKPLSTLSFNVDQTGLTGCTCGDMKKMFEGDNVVTHLSDLFDHTSQTYSVSANSHAAEAASAQDSHTPGSQLDDLVQSLKKGELSLSEYGLEEADKKLDLTNKVDAHFVAELVLIHQAIEQLQELKSYVSDGVPDVYVFTVSTLRNMEKRYGPGSSKAKLASKMVRETIQKSSKVLVDLYNERILVQALVLEWDYPEMNQDSSELAAAYTLLQPHLNGQSKELFLADLPKVSVDKDSYKDTFLCSLLVDALKGSIHYARCPTLPTAPLPEEQLFKNNRDLRQAPDEAGKRNVTVSSTSLVEERSDDFAAIFLITLFIMVSLGLAVFATSWTMWTMDPGRDSIIYRQVSDPTDGVQLK